MNFTTFRPTPALAWLASFAIVTTIFGTIYASAQQVYRQSANDPQIQIARDAAAIIQAGTDAKSLVPVQKVDLSKSLDPFMIVTDDKGAVVASSAALSGTTTPPVPPLGALSVSKASGENRITWQPRSDARLAIVIKPINNGQQYVIVGRSLSETERRVDQLGGMVAIAWMVSIVILLAVALVKLVG